MSRRFKALTLSLTLLSLATVAAAQDYSVIPNPLKAQSFGELLQIILTFLFYLSLPVAALMVMYAAWLLLVSAGDPQKVTTARNVIIYAFAGVIIIFLSRSLVELVRSALPKAGNWF